MLKATLGNILRATYRVLIINQSIVKSEITIKQVRYRRATLVAWRSHAKKGDCHRRLRLLAMTIFALRVLDFCLRGNNIFLLLYPRWHARNDDLVWMPAVARNDISYCLNAHRNTHTAADTKCYQSLFGIDLLHLVD